MPAIICKETIERMSIIFQVSEKVITDIQKSNDDLYTGLAKHFKCDRDLIKHKVHAAMYDTGPRSFAKSFEIDMTEMERMISNALRP